MARKSQMTNETESAETPEVVIVETVVADTEERPVSEQTRLEMEAGRAALALIAASRAAE